jgi:hypothetical protein
MASQQVTTTSARGAYRSRLNLSRSMKRVCEQSRSLRLRFPPTPRQRKQFQDHDDAMENTKNMSPVLTLLLL